MKLLLYGAIFRYSEIPAVIAQWSPVTIV